MFSLTLSKSAVGHFIVLAAHYFKGIEKEKSQYSAVSSWHLHTMWPRILQYYQWYHEATLYSRQLTVHWQNSKKILVNRKVGIIGGVTRKRWWIWNFGNESRQNATGTERPNNQFKYRARNNHDAPTTMQQPLTQELSLQIHCTHVT